MSDCSCLIPYDRLNDGICQRRGCGGVIRQDTEAKMCPRCNGEQLVPRAGWAPQYGFTCPECVVPEDCHECCREGDALRALLIDGDVKDEAMIERLVSKARCSTHRSEGV